MLLILDAAAAGTNLSVFGRWPGYRRGGASSVALSGTYAYVATHLGRVEIIDASDPARLFRVGGFEVADDWLNPRLVVSDKLLFVMIALFDPLGLSIQTRGLLIMDISDPRKPQQLAFFRCDPDQVPEDFIVSGNYAYVAAGDLLVVDISNPAQPELAAVYPGKAFSLAVADQFAYLAGEGLEIIDISDPRRPQRVSNMRAGLVRDVVVGGGHAYMVSITPPEIDTAIEIVDVGDPSHPQQVDRYTTGPDHSILDLTLAGNQLYLRDPSGVSILDISQAANPRPVGGYSSSDGNVSGLVKVGNLAYVTEAGSGLSAFDVSQPDRWQTLGHFQTWGQAQAVAVSGDYVYLTDAPPGVLRVIDATSPIHGQVGSCSIDGFGNSLAISGHYAFVVGGAQTGLQIIDISDLRRPQKVGTRSTQGYGSAVVVDGDYAFVADWDAGLTVLDVSNPTAPEIAGKTATFGYAADVVIQGKEAYVAVLDGGLQIFDVSDPRAPKALSVRLLPMLTRSVAVSGDYAYVSMSDRNGNSGAVAVLNVQSRRDPQLVTGVGVDRSTWKVVPSGNLLYVGSTDGVTVFDISNRGRPQLLRRATGFFGGDVAVTDGNVFVAADASGLRMLNGQEAPRLAGTHTSTEFRVSVVGVPNQVISIERSLDLNVWEEWETVTGTGTPQDILDPVTSLESRFYRVLAR